MMPTEEGQKSRHVCLTCSRPFNSKRDLIKHQYMHREKSQLTCSHCNKTFASELNYKRHLNSLQNNEKKRYHCNNCGKFFQKLRDLESHHNSEHRADKVFRCGVCQAEFCWHENLLKHEQVHDVDPHVCGACGRKFIDLTSLLVHKRTCRMSSKAEVQKKSVITKDEVDTKCQSDGGKPFTCHICGRGFKFDFSYQAHLDGHVIPAAEGNYNTNKQTVTNDPPVSGSTSKSLYVKMDNDGIIDLPALDSTSNEDVEIIVEVGNVATSETVAISSPGQQIITNNTTKQENMPDKSSLKATGEKRTSQDSSNDILKDPEEQTKDTKEKTEKIITFYEPYKKRNDEVLQTTVSRAEVPRRPYLSRPKKQPKLKREKIPFQYNCVMTDDKPFICSTCGEAFRWEISLQVHIKVHTGGKVPGIRKMYMSGRRTGTRRIAKTKNGSSQDSGAKKSRIVYQRHSSEEEEEDEEEDAEDAYAFRNGREEDKSTLPSYQHDKRFVGKKFDSETADDMLQEYLAGGDFSSDGGCNDMQLDMATKSKDATRTNSQSDGCWQKGRIILTMANAEKVERLKSSDHLQTAESDRDKLVATECDAKVMASGNEIAIMTECSINRDQNFAVACVEGSANDVGNASQVGVIGSCLMTTFPFDLTAVTNENRNAMATTYSVTSETVSIPVVIQNGFKQEEATADGGQLMMLQCIPVDASCLAVDTAVLNSGTYDRSRESAEEVSVRSSEFTPMAQHASSEITSVNLNDCTTHGPTEFESTACVSHTASKLNDTGTHVIQVNNAMTCSDNVKSGNSTRVIFFADENPIPQVDKVEEPPTSYSSLVGQAGDSQVDANFVKPGISSVNQKINAGLIALKTIVAGARGAGLKADESHLKNSAFESIGSCEGEFIKNANGTEDSTGTSNAISDVALQNEEERTIPKNQSAGHVVDIPCQAPSNKDDVKLKRLECAQCGKLFAFRTLYVKHLKRHSHVKPNYTTCIHCSKKCLSKASIDRHLMLHTA